jgi:hypothetical protein
MAITGEEIGDILKELTAQIAGSSHTTDTRLTDLTKELKELRDTRMRPYLTSMGLFVVMVMAVTGYIYNVELRFTRAFFTIQDRMQQLELHGDINSSRIEDTAERLERAIHRHEEGAQ